jgi:hypothetical protein
MVNFIANIFLTVSGASQTDETAATNLSTSIDLTALTN